MRMNALGLLTIMGLLLSVPLAAQNADLPDVGIGAPRTTLAYVVARPRTLMALAGHDGEKYVWMPQAPSEGDAEGIEKFSPDWLLDKTAKVYLPHIESASRMDIVLVDISTAGPRMYVDVTLKQGTEVELVPSWLAEFAEETGQVQITDAVFHGINVKRFSIGEDAPDLFAFVHNGHLYVCLFDTVVEGLCYGFTKGSRDGESLAESSTFQSWYKDRKGTALDVWLNAREFRRWIDRAEGALPDSAKQLYDEVEALLQIRTWTQFTLGLDYDTRDHRMTLDLDIKARRPIPLFEKTQFTSKNFGSIGKYVPDGSLYVTGFHLGDINGLVERMTADFDKLGHLVGQAERDFRPRGMPDYGYEEDGAKDAEKLPPMPEDDGRSDTVQGPGEGWEPQGPVRPELSKTPFTDMMEALKQQLAEIETTPNELFGMFDGSFLVGVRNIERSPWGDVDMFSQREMFLILGLKDAAKFQSLMEKIVAKLANEDPEGDRIQKFELNGLKGYGQAMGGPSFLIANDAVLVSFGGDPTEETSVLNTLVTTGKGGANASATVVGRLARSTATMVLGFDIFRAMTEDEDIKVEDSRKLDVNARPYFDLHTRNYFGKDFGVTAALNMDSSSLNFKIVLSGANMTKVFSMIADQEAGRVTNDHYFYADAQLNALYGKMHEIRNMGGAMPATLEEMVKSGKIGRHFLQSINDPRFENADGVHWFMGSYVDEEEDPDFPDPARAIVKANAAKDWISYTLVPNADFTKFDAPYIVAYQTNADTAGGRVVLYSTGRTGWLHASVWDEAMALTKEGKAIPEAAMVFPWGPDMGGDMPEESGEPVPPDMPEDE